MPGSADRQRRRRRRAAAGLVVLPVEVDEHAVAEALLASGRLDEVAALDRLRVAAAVGGLVAEWAASAVRGA